MEAPAPYTHATAPHAVASRAKYRDPMDGENEALASNIMWDKRVVRGNTYAATLAVLATSSPNVTQM